MEFLSQPISSVIISFVVGFLITVMSKLFNRLIDVADKYVDLGKQKQALWIEKKEQEDIKNALIRAVTVAEEADKAVIKSSVTTEKLDVEKKMEIAVNAAKAAGLEEKLAGTGLKLEDHIKSVLPEARKIWNMFSR